MVTNDMGADDAEPESEKPSHVRGRIAVLLATATSGSFLPNLANTSQVVDLFHRPWTTWVVVFGIVVAGAGGLGLVQRWREKLDWFALGALALTAVGLCGLSIMFGYGLHPGSATGEAGSTNSPASSARDIRSKGQVTVGFVGDSAIDLDRAPPKKARADAGADLSFDTNGGNNLNGLTGVKIARLPTRGVAPSKTECRNAASTGLERIVLQPDDVLCVLTSEGRIASATVEELTVPAAQGKLPLLEVTVWEE